MNVKSTLVSTSRRLRDKYKIQGRVSEVEEIIDGKNLIWRGTDAW
jgi:hypothetical protein